MSIPFDIDGSRCWIHFQAWSCAQTMLIDTDQDFRMARNEDLTQIARRQCAFQHWYSFGFHAIKLNQFHPMMAIHRRHCPLAKTKSLFGKIKNKYFQLFQSWRLSWLFYVNRFFNRWFVIQIVKRFDCFVFFFDVILNYFSQVLFFTQLQ